MQSEHHFKMFRDALHLSVYGDLERFKQETFRAAKSEVTRCALTNVAINEAHSQVAYIPPYTLDSMVWKFIKRHNLDVTRMVYDEQGTRQVITDAKMLIEWRRYHWLHAHLQLVQANDAFAIEESDSVKALREQFRAEFIARGYRYRGNPITT